jgi:hypothetical protein
MNIRFAAIDGPVGRGAVEGRDPVAVAGDAGRVVDEGRAAAGVGLAHDRVGRHPASTGRSSDSAQGSRPRRLKRLRRTCRALESRPLIVPIGHLN